MPCTGTMNNGKCNCGGNSALNAPRLRTQRLACFPFSPALLREFARWIDIRLYTRNPCRQYWGDWVSAAQRADLALHGQADHAEVGNVLLTEWGQQTQT